MILSITEYGANDNSFEGSSWKQKCNTYSLLKMHFKEWDHSKFINTKEQFWLFEIPS